jgi:thioredoxin 1
MLDSNAMEVLNTDSFKARIFDFTIDKTWNFKGSKPTVIDFYADWCGPCHQLNPILEEVSAQFSGAVEFYKINTEQSPELAALFEVRSIPSLLFIPLGEEPAMSSGFVPKEKLEQAIREIFAL